MAVKRGSGISQVATLGDFGDFDNFSKSIVGVPCSVDSVIMAFKVDTKSFTQSLSNT